MLKAIFFFCTLNYFTVKYPHLSSPCSLLLSGLNVFF